MTGAYFYQFEEGTGWNWVVVMKSYMIGILYHLIGGTAEDAREKRTV